MRYNSDRDEFEGRTILELFTLIVTKITMIERKLDYMEASIRDLKK